VALLGVCVVIQIVLQDGRHLGFYSKLKNYQKTAKIEKF